MLQLKSFKNSTVTSCKGGYVQMTRMHVEAIVLATENYKMYLSLIRVGVATTDIYT